MKKRKILSLIVAMLMVMSSCLPVLATETENNGLRYDDTTLEVTSTGNVTIREIDENVDPSIDFDTYQILYAKYDKDTNTIKYYLTSWAEAALVTYGSYTEDEAIEAIKKSEAVNGGSTTEGNSSTEQTNVLNTLAAYIVSAASGTPVDKYNFPQTGETDWVYNDVYHNASANLAVGVYLVVPTANNMSFLNTMVSVNEKTSGLNDNNWTVEAVGAVLKGTRISIEKTVEDCDIASSTQDTSSKTAEVQVGDTVTYTLVFDVPTFSLTASNYTFKVVDTPTNVKVVDTSKVVVKALTSVQTISDWASADLLYEENASIPSGSTVGYELTQDATSGAIIIDFTDYYDDIFRTTLGVYPYTKVAVQYEAVVLDTAVTGSTGNTNEAVLDFSYDGLTRTASENATVYTYKAVLTKYGENSDQLNGAEFTIYPANQSGYSATPLQFIKNSDGNYSVYDGVSSYTAGTLVNTVTTATDGTLTITGLDANVSYKIEETVAPSGYTLNTNYLTFTIIGSLGSITSDPTNVEYDSSNTQVDANRSWTAGRDTTNPDDNYLTLSLKDTKLAAMPAAGGVGIIVFTILGVCLMIVAVFLMTSSKDKKKQA